MRTLLLVLATILVPRSLTAQNATADGVHALIRGDYEAAVRILRPLAEEAAQPDPVAQFFMATIYDSSRGGTGGSFRACGLYRSAAASSNPLMEQARDLAEFIQQISPGVARFCVAPSRSGKLPSAEFALAPDHTFTIDDTGATVRYRGTERHAIFDFSQTAVSLPILYTPLDVTGPPARRRYFLQYFGWWRDANNPDTWSLGWTVTEVVGLDLVPITGDPEIIRLNAAEPPLAFDVAAAAGVRLNADGEAEWVILAGPTPRSGVISAGQAR
jgi:hypothetical protein